MDRSTHFSVTFDYRCPFARNAHEHVVTALEGGAEWEVDFVPFSLSQMHLEEGEEPVWDDPAKAPDLFAIECALVVRERHPEAFLGVHRAFFRARHDEARDLRDEDVVRAVLEQCGIDAQGVIAAVAEGWPRELFRKEHESAAASHQVFGVPTFVRGDDAVFVRIMTRPEIDDDAEVSKGVIENVLRLMDENPELNEFKHTSIAR